MRAEDIPFQMPVDLQEVIDKRLHEMQTNSVKEHVTPSSSAVEQQLKEDEKKQTDPKQPHRKKHLSWRKKADLKLRQEVRDRIVGSKAKQQKDIASSAPTSSRALTESGEIHPSYLKNKSRHQRQKLTKEVSSKFERFLTPEEKHSHLLRKRQVIEIKKTKKFADSRNRYLKLKAERREQCKPKAKRQGEAVMKNDIIAKRDEHS